MSDASYQPKTYRKQGGDELVVASGGALTVESGGTLTIASGATFTMTAGGFAEYLDGVSLTFGTGADVTAQWDGTNLIVAPAADDALIEVGDAGTPQLSCDVKVYGNAAAGADYLLWDASASALSFGGAAAQGVTNRTIGGSTAAAGSATGDAGVLPAGTAPVYPTTAADDTKGVRVHASDKVTGRMLFVGNGVSDKVLKVYAPSGGTINGAAADAAFSSVSGKGVVILCLDATANTWLAW